MYLLISDEDAFLNAVCLCVNKNGKYVFIDKNEFFSDVQLQESLQKFSDDCVLRVKNSFNIEIKYLVYDSSYTLDSIPMDNNLKYVKIKCLRSIGTDIKNIFDRVMAVAPIALGIDVLETIVSFKTSYENLNTAFQVKHMYLNDAVEEILKFFQKFENFLSSYPLLREEMYEILTPVLLGSNFFHNVYRGKLFPQNGRIMNKFLSFIRTIPEGNVDKVMAYKQSNKGFEEYNEMNPIQYWTFYNQAFPTLSEIGLQLAFLPAFVPKINVSKLVVNTSKLVLNENFDSASLWASLTLEED